MCFIECLSNLSCCWNTRPDVTCFNVVKKQRCLINNLWCIGLTVHLPCFFVSNYLVVDFWQFYYAILIWHLCLYVYLSVRHAVILLETILHICSVKRFSPSGKTIILAFRAHAVVVAKFQLALKHGEGIIFVFNRNRQIGLPRKRYQIGLWLIWIANSES